MPERQWTPLAADIITTCGEFHHHTYSVHLSGILEKGFKPDEGTCPRPVHILPYADYDPRLRQSGREDADADVVIDMSRLFRDVRGAMPTHPHFWISPTGAIMVS